MDSLNEETHLKANLLQGQPIGNTNSNLQEQQWKFVNVYDEASFDLSGHSLDGVKKTYHLSLTILAITVFA